MQRRGGSQISLVVKKEFRLLWKDKKTLLIYFLGPILIISAVGATGGVSLERGGHLTVAIAQQDQTTFGTDLANQFLKSQHMTVIQENERSAQDDLKWDKVQAVIVIPQGFGDRVKSGENASIRMSVDNTDTFAPQSAQLAATEALANFQKELTKKMGASSNASIGLDSSNFYKGTWKQTDVASSKVLPLVLIWVPMMMTGMTIVSERIRGTLSRSLKTPLSRLNMIFGKMLAYIPIVIAQIILILSFAKAAFNLSISGNVLDVFLILFITALVGMSIGMIISILGTTDRQVTEAIPVIVLMLINLGGVFIPVRLMPNTMQTIARGIPLYYSIKAMNGALLKGYGLEYIGGEVSMLLLFAVGFIALAIVLFHFEEKAQQIMKF